MNALAQHMQIGAMACLCATGCRLCVQLRGGFRAALVSARGVLLKAFLVGHGLFLLLVLYHDVNSLRALQIS